MFKSNKDNEPKDALPDIKNKNNNSDPDLASKGSERQPSPPPSYRHAQQSYEQHPNQPHPPPPPPGHRGYPPNHHSYGGYGMFNEYDDKWNCCCSAHITKGAKIVAVISLILMVISAIITVLYFLLVGDMQDKQNSRGMTVKKQQQYDKMADDVRTVMIVITIVFYIILLIVEIICVLFMFKGIKKTKPGFAVPFLAFLIILAILNLVMMNFPMAILYGYFGYVLYRLYTFLKEKDKAIKGGYYGQSSQIPPQQNGYSIQQY